MTMELDDTRLDILAARGHLLVEGGPGCGKTTIALLKAAHEVPRLAEEQKVLFLSFSRAAVRQIADRMATTLPRAVADRVEIRTFHAFFLSLVRSHSRLLTMVPARFITPAQEKRLQADFEGDWPSETLRLAGEGRYVFDQLAATAATLLERSDAVRGLYSDCFPLIVVDEFQDTNTDQWRAIHALSTSSTIMFLADADQRIYDHIPGVDAARIAHAVEHLAPRAFDLSADNHRGHGNGLLAYANAVRANQHHPEPDCLRTRRYPYQCEPAVHRHLLEFRSQLQRQLGRSPTIAVLACTNALVADISERISIDRPSANGVLEAVAHHLHWDPLLASAAAEVIASILTWPSKTPDRATSDTLRAIADFHRVRFADKGTRTARDAVNMLERAITAVATGKAPKSSAGKTIRDAVARGIVCSGDPVQDWATACLFLTGPVEVAEVAAAARQLRLFKATDALAWAVQDAWDGHSSYRDPVAVVRCALRRRPAGHTPRPCLGQPDDHPQVQGQGVRRRRRFGRRMWSLTSGGISSSIPGWRGRPWTPGSGSGRRRTM
ncbi:UvrD-helicase domain-containing protein [Allokutzneria oryzae]|uniref:UvrD-helicase domain-containing protein n=1 Tax=Allokutzneria oryzae TaxID=1378989 RepID=A0ABV5ZPS6_9PSEU